MQITRPRPLPLAPGLLATIYERRGIVPYGMATRHVRGEWTVGYSTRGTWPSTKDRTCSRYAAGRLYNGTGQAGEHRTVLRKYCRSGRRLLSEGQILRKRRGRWKGRVQLARRRLCRD